MVRADGAVVYDDDARTQTLLYRLRPLLLWSALAEEPAKERIVHERKMLRLPPTHLRMNRPDCRRDLGHRVGVRSDWRERGIVRSGRCGARIRARLRLQRKPFAIAGPEQRDCNYDTQQNSNAHEIILLVRRDYMLTRLT